MDIDEDYELQARQRALDIYFALADHLDTEGMDMEKVDILRLVATQRCAVDLASRLFDKDVGSNLAILELTVYFLVPNLEIDDQGNE